MFLAFPDEGVRKRERALKEDCCRTGTRQVDPQGKPGLSKAKGLTVDGLLQGVIHTRQKLGTSQRRTCRVIGVARSTQQYKPTNQQRDEELRLALIGLAKHYGRYGYRKIAELLRIEGWKVNHKRVERIWREEGLQDVDCSG